MKFLYTLYFQFNASLVQEKKTNIDIFFYSQSVNLAASLKSKSGRRGIGEPAGVWSNETYDETSNVYVIDYIE